MKAQAEGKYVLVNDEGKVVCEIEGKVTYPEVGMDFVIEAIDRLGEGLASTAKPRGPKA